jgi:hypothetical protein
VVEKENTSAPPREGITASSNAREPARLYAVLAREALVGVIFRRGPSKRTRLIRWETANDRFDAGQWFHGRIYEKRSDLSPDGTLLVYFAAKHKPPIYSWTAISRPPYLTAISLWPKRDCWAGGGLFEDTRTLWLNHKPADVLHEPVQSAPVGIEVIPNAQAYGEDYPIESRRWLRDGWVHVQEMQARCNDLDKGYVTEREDVWQRKKADVSTVLERRVSITGYIEKRRYALLDGTDAELYVAGDATWADWDHSGRLVVARDGMLLAVTVETGGTVRERVIADFTEMVPEPIESPEWAKTW